MDCNCRKCEYWSLRYTLDNISSDKQFHHFPWWNEPTRTQDEWLEAAIREVNSKIRSELGG